MPRCRAFVERAHSLAPRVDLTFHRAFDVVADADEALEQLVDLGITRILTSGRAKTALEGAAEIRRTRERARGRIEILTGGGISAARRSRSWRQVAALSSLAGSLLTRLAWLSAGAASANPKNGV